MHLQLSVVLAMGCRCMCVCYILTLQMSCFFLCLLLLHSLSPTFISHLYLDESLAFHSNCRWFEFQLNGLTHAKTLFVQPAFKVR